MVCFHKCHAISKVSGGIQFNTFAHFYNGVSGIRRSSFLVNSRFYAILRKVTIAAADATGESLPIQISAKHQQPLHLPRSSFECTLIRSEDCLRPFPGFGHTSGRSAIKRSHRTPTNNYQYCMLMECYRCNKTPHTDVTSTL